MAVRPVAPSLEETLYAKLLRHLPLAETYAATLPVEGLDIIHDAYVRCLKQVRSGALLLTESENYLIRAINNSARDQSRRVYWRRTDSIDQALLALAGADETDRAAEQAILHERWQHALARLTPMERKVAELRLNQYKYTDIEAETGVLAGTARAHMTSARPKLRRALGL